MYIYIYIYTYIYIYIILYFRVADIEWVARWIGRAGRWRPTREHTSKQTSKPAETAPEPNPPSQRTQGSKYAARARPHSNKYISYIYI